MKEMNERAVMEGYPVEFKFETADNDTNLTELTLESDNVDIDGSGVPATTPFKEKMLIIVGVDIKNGASNVLEGFFVDGKCLVNGTAKGMVAADRFQANGEQVTIGSAGNSPVLKDLIGEPYLPCRSKLGVKASASGAGSKTTAIIRAFVLPCRF